MLFHMLNLILRIFGTYPQVLQAVVALKELKKENNRVREMKVDIIYILNTMLDLGGIENELKKTHQGGQWPCPCWLLC